MRRIGSVAAATTLVVGLLSETALAQELVTYCGQTVAEGGVLAADLDCSSSDTSGIVLEHRATLDLGGFTLTTSEYPGVACSRSCTIVGSGGTITGASHTAVSAPRGHLVASDLTVSTTGDLVLANLASGLHGKIVTASAVTIVGTAGYAIYGLKGLAISNSTLTDNLGGFGFFDIFGRVNLTNTVLSGHRVPSFGRRVEIAASSFTNNPGGGVGAGRTMRAKNSVFSGNGSAPECVSPVFCPDIQARQAPLLLNVSCETSIQVDGQGDPVGTFGICSLD